MSANDPALPEFTGEDMFNILRNAGFHLMERIDRIRSDLVVLNNPGAPLFKHQSLPWRPHSDIAKAYQLDYNPDTYENRLRLENELTEKVALLEKINAALLRHDLDVMIPAMVEAVKRNHT